MKSVRLMRLGLADYSSTLQLQTRLFNASNFENTLIVVEHPSTVTAGNRSTPLEIQQASKAASISPIQVITCSR